MRFVTRTLAPIAVALGVLLSATWAHADPLSKPASPEARSHLSLGNKLYGVRSFEEAVAEYKAGALIEPAPVFDYNLGQCFRQLGKYQEAIWHYERFLARGDPQGELLGAVNGFIAQMKGELERKAMSQQPTEPAPLTTPPHVEQPTKRSEAWYEDGWGWALAGAGGVGVAVSGGLLADASSINGVANMTANQQERDRLKSQVHTRNLLGATIGIGGVGLLAAGIVKLAIHPKEQQRLTSWNIAIVGNGVWVLGEF